MVVVVVVVVVATTMMVVMIMMKGHEIKSKNNKMKSETKLNIFN